MRMRLSHSHCMLLELLYVNPDAFAVGGEFGGVETLNGGDSIAEVTSMRNEHGIFKYISSFS